MSESQPDDKILGALSRWNEGDESALNELLSATIPWLNREIGYAWRTSPHASLSAEDIVQTAVLNFLQWGPKYQPQSPAQFRALLKRVAMNELIDATRRAGRRGGRHLDSIAATGYPLSAFPGPSNASLAPSRAAARSEEQAWVRLALQFLEPDERYLILASKVEERDWSTIAGELGLASPDAARMQAKRLEPRVANLLRRLKLGHMPESVV